MDDAKLIRLYDDQSRAVDDLPYTAELDNIRDGYNVNKTLAAMISPREAYKRLQQLRKASKLVRKGRATITSQSENNLD